MQLRGTKSPRSRNHAWCSAVSENGELQVNAVCVVVGSVFIGFTSATRSATVVRCFAWARRSESRPFAAQKVGHLRSDGGLAESRDSESAGRMLRMDQVHVVRHKVLVEGRTQRAVARELGLSRTTVGKYPGPSGAGSESGSRASPAAGVGHGRRAGARDPGGLGAVDSRQTAADRHAAPRVVAGRGETGGLFPLEMLILTAVGIPGFIGGICVGWIVGLVRRSGPGA